MKAVYFDFKQGLRGVLVSDVLSEYQFAKENGLKFVYPVLAMALSSVKGELNFISFQFICNEGNIEESTIFRTVAKLQHQVSRREENENKLINELQDELTGDDFNIDDDKYEECEEYEECNECSETEDESMFELIEGEE